MWPFAARGGNDCLRHKQKAPSIFIGFAVAVMFAVVVCLSRERGGYRETVFWISLTFIFVQFNQIMCGWMFEYVNWNRTNDELYFAEYVYVFGEGCGEDGLKALWKLNKHQYGLWAELLCGMDSILKAMVCGLKCKLFIWYCPIYTYYIHFCVWHTIIIIQIMQNFN